MTELLVIEFSKRTHDLQSLQDVTLLIVSTPFEMLISNGELHCVR